MSLESSKVFMHQHEGSHGRTGHVALQLECAAAAPGQADQLRAIGRVAAKHVSILCCDTSGGILVTGALLCV